MRPLLRWEGWKGCIVVPPWLTFSFIFLFVSTSFMKFSGGLLSSKPFGRNFNSRGPEIAAFSSDWLSCMIAIVKFKFFFVFSSACQLETRQPPLRPPQRRRRARPRPLPDRPHRRSRRAGIGRPTSFLRSSTTRS